MPSPLDDLPVHQTAAPLPEPATSDTHFNDGYYFAFYAPGVHVFAGLRLHPNTNVMDGYGGAVAHGTQRNLRVSRALRPSTYPFNDRPAAAGDPRADAAPARDAAGERERRRASTSRSPRSRRPSTRPRTSSTATAACTTTSCATRRSCRAHGTLTIDGATHADRRLARRARPQLGHPLDDGPAHPGQGHRPGQRPRPPRAPALGAVRDTRPQRLLPHARGRTREHARLRGPDRLQGRRLARARARGARRSTYDATASGAARSPSPTRPARHTRTRFEVACEPAHPQGFGYTRGWSDGGQPGVYRGEYVTEHERFDVTQPNAAPEHVPAHAPPRRHRVRLHARRRRHGPRRAHAL